MPSMMRGTTRLLFVVLIATYIAAIYGFKIDQDSLHSDNDGWLIRGKRDLEAFDDVDEYPSANQEEEESGFWDRVVKIAMKIFSKFVDWLNS